MPIYENTSGTFAEFSSNDKGVMSTLYAGNPTLAVGYKKDFTPEGYSLNDKKSLYAEVKAGYMLDTFGVGTSSPLPEGYTNFKPLAAAKIGFNDPLDRGTTGIFASIEGKTSLENKTGLATEACATLGHKFTDADIEASFSAQKFKNTPVGNPTIFNATFGANYHVLQRENFSFSIGPNVNIRKVEGAKIPRHQPYDLNFGVKSVLRLR